MMCAVTPLNPKGVSNLLNFASFEFRMPEHHDDNPRKGTLCKLAQHVTLQNSTRASCLLCCCNVSLLSLCLSNLSGMLHRRSQSRLHLLRVHVCARIIILPIHYKL